MQRSNGVAMRFEAGYLTVGSCDGAPVRIHWTTPFAAVVFGAGGWAPAIWLGFCLVILAHELGHALMVHRVGGRIDSIDATGWGGHCLWSGDPTLFEDALVAAGGLLAQAAGLLAAAGIFLIFGRPQSAFAVDLVQAFVGVNLTLALINAIPIEPLDGARAWRLLPFVIEWLEVQRLKSWRFTADRPRPRGRDKRRNYAKVVTLDERLDQQLDRILSSAQQTSEGERRAPPRHQDTKNT
jgi:Zn-dependent protease